MLSQLRSTTWNWSEAVCNDFSLQRFVLLLWRWYRDAFIYEINHRGQLRMKDYCNKHLVRGCFRLRRSFLFNFCVRIFPWFWRLSFSSVDYLKVSLSKLLQDFSPTWSANKGLARQECVVLIFSSLWNNVARFPVPFFFQVLDIHVWEKCIFLLSYQ